MLGMVGLLDSSLGRASGTIPHLRNYPLLWDFWRLSSSPEELPTAVGLVGGTLVEVDPPAGHHATAVPVVAPEALCNGEDEFQGSRDVDR